MSVIRRAALLALALAPAPSGAAPHLVVSDSTYHLTSDRAPDTLVVREIEFADPVLAAHVDSTSGTVLALIGTKTEGNDPSDRSIVRKDLHTNRILVYDLHERRIIWDQVTQTMPVTALRMRGLLAHGNGSHDLVRLINGQKLGTIDGTPFLWSDGVCLRVTDKAVIGWRLEDSGDLWRVDRDVRGKVDDVIRRDSVAYVLAEGLQKIDLRGGALWSFAVRANRSGLYHDELGGTVHMSGYGGSRAVNLTGRPLIQGDDVYFAAETTVVRLDGRTGGVVWRQHLQRSRGFSLKERAMGISTPSEFLGRLLVRDAGANVAIASLGWASGPKVDLIADPASLAIMAKSDGRTVARVQVQGTQFLIDERSTPRGHYLMGTDRLMVLDGELKVRSTFVVPQYWRPLGGFIEVGGPIVVATASGIAALSSDSLRVLWTHPSGRMLAEEEHADLAGAWYFMTTQGLYRFDLGTGHGPGAYFPLRGTWADFVWMGAIMGSGTKLRLIALPPRNRLYRAD